MKWQEQLDKWVEGESLHNHDAPVTGSECCPDFSCCIPELQALRSTRGERELAVDAVLGRAAALQSSRGRRSGQQTR